MSNLNVICSDKIQLTISNWIEQYKTGMFSGKEYKHIPQDVWQNKVGWYKNRRLLRQTSRNLRIKTEYMGERFMQITDSKMFDHEKQYVGLTIKPPQLGCPQVVCMSIYELSTKNKIVDMVFYAKTWEGKRSTKIYKDMNKSSDLMFEGAWKDVRNWFKAWTPGMKVES